VPSTLGMSHGLRTCRQDDPAEHCLQIQRDVMIARPTVTQCFPGGSLMQYQRTRIMRWAYGVPAHMT